jgi:tRNA G18 (ribose-2'-O)-methylase SpoU
MQLDHYSNNFEQRTFPIILICDNVSNAPNIGGLLRTSDAFGITKVFFCGQKIEFNRKAKKSSRATENYVNFEMQDNINNVLLRLKNENYYFISLEITSKSQSLSSFKLPKNRPIALIVGHENFGIQESVLNNSDSIIHIDMFGKNSSMNVVQSTNIALYEITKQMM